MRSQPVRTVLKLLPGGLTLTNTSINYAHFKADEHATGRDDGRSDYGPGRSKGGGTPANGQGKPKKGRTAPRDGKRIRPSADQEFEDEDDPDLSLR
ncbi:hypothetical protein ACLOJK_009613 [Asimina triloba]